MSQFNKAKLYLVLSVMIAFTLVNILNGNGWIGYLFSIVILPLITWGIIEFITRRKLW